MALSFLKPRAFLREMVVTQMVRMLPNLSMKNLMKIVELGEKLINKEDYKAVVASFKQYIKEEHPATKLIERVLYELSPQ